MWEKPTPAGKGKGEGGGVKEISSREKKKEPSLLFPKLTNLACQMQVQLMDNALTTDNLHSNCCVT